MATSTDGSGWLGEYLGLDVPHGTRICPVPDCKVWCNPHLGIQVVPMIGTVGTVPTMGVPTIGLAGPHGGNMDIKEVTEGNTLYLPVFVSGALLHLGDVHLAQGKGELCGMVLEMFATVTISVDLIKGKSIVRPRTCSD